jgi:hypothetical protein
MDEPDGMDEMDRASERRVAYFGLGSAFGLVVK